MARDTGTEHWLNHCGVEWEYLGNVEFTEIDEKTSRANHARFEAYNEAHVDEMVVAYMDGARFPAPIAWRGGRGYVYIDGNHRHGMRLKVGDKSTDMYVVKTRDEYVVEYLTRCANMRNGAALSLDERMESAKYIVRKYNRPVTQIAKLFGLKDAALERAIIADKVRVSLRAAGIDSSVFQVTTLEKLNALSNLPVRLEAANAIRNYAISTDEVRDFVKSIRMENSEAAQLAFIKEYMARPEFVARRAQSRGGKDNSVWRTRGFIFNRLQQLCGKFERHTLAELQITTTEDKQRLAVEYRKLRNLIDVRLEEGRRSNDSKVSNIVGDNGRS